MNALLDNAAKTGRIIKMYKNNPAIAVRAVAESYIK